VGKKRKQRKSDKLDLQKQRLKEMTGITPAASTWLNQARTYWLFGEWQRLMSITENELLEDSERAHVALLVSSAHQQVGDHDATRHWARNAIHWGLAPSKVARLLAAGVHNTLGRIAILRSDEANMGKHFMASTQLAHMKDTDTGTVARAKAIQEANALQLRLPAALLTIADDSAPTNSLNDGFYRAFEDKFRGSREEIKRRVHVYLPFIMPVAERHPNIPALDLGCEEVNG
jgi:hypothetical protein